MTTHEIIEFPIDQPSELSELFEAITVLEPVDKQILQEKYDYIKQRYGDNPYHNHHHALSVTCRAQTIWSALSAALPESFCQQDQRLLAIASIGHDSEQSLPGFGENEQASATAAMLRVFDEPTLQPLNAGIRLYDAIIATVVKRDDQGTIIQTNLRAGSRDPLKLVLAMADINGIAMGGVSTMIDDATNLFMEINGYRTCLDILAHAKDFARFLQTQAHFLNDRLQSIDGDVDYYFESEDERAAVKQVLAELFQPGKEALQAAAILEDPRKSLDYVGFIIGHGTSTVKDVKSRLTGILTGLVLRSGTDNN